MANVPKWEDTTEVAPTWDNTQEVSSIATIPKLEEPISKTESALRGAAQGITFGFADELQAKTEELLSGEDYDKRIKEIRAANQAAADENPLSYYGADIASGFLLPIGGIGAAAKGGTLLARAGKTAAAGAAIGGLTGVGTSEGEDAQEVAKDAAMGATAGAIAGPVLEGAIGGVKALASGTGKKVGALADIRDFFKYGRQGTQLTGRQAAERVTGEGFEAVEKELIPELEESLKLKNKLFEEGKKEAESAGRTVQIQQLEDLVNKAESAGVDPKQIEKLRRELSILGKKQEVEVSDPKEYQELFRKKVGDESQKLKERAYEVQLKNADKAGAAAAKEADKQNKELLKLAQAEVKALNPSASNEELIALAQRQLAGKLKDPATEAATARAKAIEEAQSAYRGQKEITDPVTGEDLVAADVAKNKRVIEPAARGEDGNVLNNVAPKAGVEIQKAADKNAAYAYALAERENNKATQELAKVYGQQQMSMTRDNLIAELKSQGKWIDPVSAARKAKDETLLSGKAIDVSTTFSPEINRSVLTASAGDEELARKILPEFKFTKQEYQKPEMGVRDVEAFRNFLKSVTDKDPMIDFRSTQELQKVSQETKGMYNKLLGEDKAKVAMNTDKSVRKSLAELGVDSLVRDSGIENKVDLRDKLSRIMAQANTAKGANEAVKVENAFKGLQEIYKNDPVKLQEVTAAFDKVKDKMRQAYLSDITTGHNTFAIDPTSINWTMTASGKIGMAANELGFAINKIAESTPGQMMGQAKRFLDRGYKSYSAAFEKMSMQTPEKRRAMMYVLLQQPEFRQAFSTDLVGAEGE